MWRMRDTVDDVNPALAQRTLNSGSYGIFLTMGKGNYSTFLTMGKGNYGMFHTMGTAGFISSTVLPIRGKPQVQRLVQQWPWPSADALLPDPNGSGS